MVTGLDLSLQPQASERLLLLPTLCCLLLLPLRGTSPFVIKGSRVIRTSQGGAVLPIPVWEMTWDPKIAVSAPCCCLTHAHKAVTHARTHARILPTEAQMYHRWSCLLGSDGYIPVMQKLCQPHSHVHRCVCTHCLGRQMCIEYMRLRHTVQTDKFSLKLQTHSPRVCTQVADKQRLKHRPGRHGACPKLPEMPQACGVLFASTAVPCTYWHEES